MTPWSHDMEPVRIGVIGSGSISSHYLQAARAYPVLDMIACADIDHAAAERLGAECVAAPESEPGAVRHRGQHSAPDPNGFGGPVAVADPEGEWTEVPLGAGPTEDARSIGLADLCIGLRTGAPHRCNGKLAQHVLEVMAALDRSATERTQIEIDSRPDRPAPLAAAP